MVFLIPLLYEWTCEIDIATLFLMLTSKTTMIKVKSVKMFAKVDLFAFLIFLYCMIKRKTTRKIVN